jgi:hypothetical protein
MSNWVQLPEAMAVSPPIKNCFRRNGDPVTNLREAVSKVDNVPFRPRVDVAHRLTETPYETKKSWSTFS